ncbi:hypothetical protein BDV59DRAFT_24267 [Aspergillus ambiguus]|uniref:uncharacterized protein n=1 Tax=Aspergillus ambiguus TaxID=176160 RepID=UPI003CCD5B00
MGISASPLPCLTGPVYRTSRRRLLLLAVVGHDRISLGMEAEMTPGLRGPNHCGGVGPPRLGLSSSEAIDRGAGCWDIVNKASYRSCIDAVHSRLQ